MHPILFSPTMSRASRSGTKTQTRRIVALPGWATPGSLCLFNNMPWASDPTKGGDRHIESPYGKPGDKLWVREEHFRFGHWKPIEGARTKKGRQKWAFVPSDEFVRYPDDHDAPKDFRKGRHHKDPSTRAWHKRLARYMPRKLSRTTLEIVSIRAERLQDISPADALAEGMETLRDEWSGKCQDFDETLTDLQLYKILWESLHGPDSWAANPYVWVITFRPI